MEPKSDNQPQDAVPPLSVEEPEIREHLVTTAVKFLQNPKVRESNFSQRRLFLEKKGLTKQEIDLAIQRSGTVSDETGTSVATYPQAPVLPSVPTQPVPTPTKWSRLKDTLLLAVVISGASYGLYKLYKKYLLPYLRGEDSETSRLQRVEKQVTELNTNLTQTLTKIQDTLSAMQQLLSQQQEKMQSISYHGLNKSQSGDALMAIQEKQDLRDIKNELSSLKGLLLNRRQFPPTPIQTPIIPTWQLQESPVKVTASGDENDTEETKAGESLETQPDVKEGPDVTEKTVFNGDVSLQARDDVQFETEDGQGEGQEHRISPVSTGSEENSEVD